MSLVQRLDSRMVSLVQRLDSRIVSLVQRLDSRMVSLVQRLVSRIVYRDWTVTELDNMLLFTLNKLLIHTSLFVDLTG